MSGRYSRVDDLHDAGNWTDRGCEYFPACLDCPERVCLFELPALERRARTDRLEHRVRAVPTEGGTAHAR